MADVVFAVLLLNILNDLFALVVSKVTVDVGRGRTQRIEETLEGNNVLNRVENVDGVEQSHDRPRRRTTRVNHDPVVTAEAHDIAEDQEVVGVALSDDDVEFVLDSLDIFANRVALEVLGLVPFQDLEVRGHCFAVALEVGVFFVGVDFFPLDFTFLGAETVDEANVGLPPQASRGVLTLGKVENREVRLVRVLVEVGPEFYLELCLQLCGLEALGRVGVLLLKLLDGGQVGVAA